VVDEATDMEAGGLDDLPVKEGKGKQPIKLPKKLSQNT
jgi:hypothetical protein